MKSAVIVFPGSNCDRDAARALRDQGVESLPLSGYCAAARLPPGLVLGFGAVDEDELDRAAPRVARVLEAMRTASATRAPA